MSTAQKRNHQSSNPPSTDFEDEVEPKQPAKIDDSPPPPKDIDGVPYCPDHHCRMKFVSGGKKESPTSYLRCPVDGCQQKGQMIKTRRESVVPSAPVTCPRCESEPVCSRNTKLSTGAYVILQCPRCGWNSNSLALPSLAAHHHDVMNPARKRHQEAEQLGIGDR